MHNRSKDHCSPKRDILLRQRQSPHSHGTPVDVVPTTAGIPSTLNPLRRYHREFQSHDDDVSAVLPQIPPPRHSLVYTRTNEPMINTKKYKRRNSYYKMITRYSDKLNSFNWTYSAGLLPVTFYRPAALHHAESSSDHGDSGDPLRQPGMPTTDSLRWYSSV